jgi:hypothetical protein
MVQRAAVTGDTAFIGADVALRWLSDLFGVCGEFGWGYALWNFAGDFGIVEHGRPGARYEERHRYKVDRTLFDLLLENRVTARTGRVFWEQRRVTARSARLSPMPGSDFLHFGD